MILDPEWREDEQDEDKGDDDASEKSSSDGTEKFEIVNWKVIYIPGHLQMEWLVCNFHNWKG